MPFPEPMHPNSDEKFLPQWFVMRDLKRPNAKCRAYQWLAEQGFEVFTPMKWEVTGTGARKTRRCRPFLFDLLFVHSTRESLDPVVSLTPTLQYRFLRGSALGVPMTVREADMDFFMRAVQATEEPRYFTPGEITPAMLGKFIRVVGGPFDGYEGRLLSVRGTRKRHLLVEVPTVLATTVEIDPEYIELLK